MYHGIHDTGVCDGIYDSIYSVSLSGFKEHLSWLSANAFNAKRINDLKGHDCEKNDIVITFDDGDLSNYTVAFQLLAEKNFSAEFFITTDRIGTKRSMSKAHLREMAESGMSIQSHTVSHRFLSDLTSKDIEFELKHSKETLEDITGHAVNGIALPGGRGNKEVSTIAFKLGYETICDSRMGFNSYLSKNRMVKRLSIYRSTNLKAFKSLINGTGEYYYKMLAKERVLKIPKIILGNDLYNSIRSKCLGE